MSALQNGALRPSNLPKLAVCPCYESNPVAGPAAERGTLLDAAFRAELLGLEERFVIANRLTADEIAAVSWSVSMVRAMSGRERVLARAKSIVAEARALKSDVAVAREGLSGTLRLGVIPTALASVHDLTRPFLDSHPGVRLRILSLNSHLIVEKLTEFEIDAGLSYASADLPADRLPGYTTMPLYEESYALVTRRHPDLPASMAWADVAGFELGLLTPDMQNRRIIDRNLKRAGVAVTPRLESNSIIGLVSHVTEHHSATILPSRTAVFYATGRDLVCIPLTGGVSGIADVALLLPPLGRRTLLLDAFIESIAQGF